MTPKMTAWLIAACISAGLWALLVELIVWAA